VKNRKNKSDFRTNEETVSIVSEATIAYSMPLHIGYIANTNSEMDTLKLIKKGVPKNALDKTMQMMDFSLDEMSNLLHISERTLRRYDESAHLNIEQSERIIELNNLYQYGVQVLGNLDSFKIWINSPILALGQQKPKSFLDTSLGICMLKNILGRIEHGVYS
jgi:putative toxin-antitoxin system antitoxin component (TIGR02293 family)